MSESKPSKYRVAVEIEMNLRDWAAFEDLALQKDIDFHVEKFMPIKRELEVEVPKKKKNISPGRRKSPTYVTKEIIDYVAARPDLSNVQISKTMPEQLRVADSTISSIRLGHYDNIKKYAPKRK